MLSHGLYLLFDIAVATSLLGVSWFKRDFWLAWRGMVRGFLLVSVPFLLWDIWATAQGHWAFSGDYTIGFRIFGLPVEEVLFFVIVPLACMAVWHLMGDDSKRYKSRYACVPLLCVGVALLIVSTLMAPLSYTNVVFIAAGVTAIGLVRYGGLIAQRKFWRFQLIYFGLFLICNMILTGIPVVTYGQDAILGLRVGTIPIEDFLYNFVLINWFLVQFIGEGNSIGCLSTK